MSIVSNVLDSVYLEMRPTLCMDFVLAWIQGIDLKLPIHKRLLAKLPLLEWWMYLYGQEKQKSNYSIILAQFSHGHSNVSPLAGRRYLFLGQFNE